MHYPVPVNGTGQSASPFRLPLPATEAARLLGKGGEEVSFLPLTTCDPQRNTRRLLSPLALKRTLGVRLPSNLVIFNNKMGAATLLPLRMVG